MGEKVITWLELQKHITKTDCWLLIEEKVYDVTPYMDEHPGGSDVLVKYAGRDSTDAFKNDVNHTVFAISVRDQHLVGSIEKGPQPKEYQDWVKEQLKVDGKYTWEEIRKHNKPTDCWGVIHGKVYDFTSYLDKHPGGPVVIEGRAGKDATKAFELARHPESALKAREQFQIGLADGRDTSEDKLKDTSVFNLTNLIVAVLLAALAYYFYTKPQ